MILNGPVYRDRICFRSLLSGTSLAMLRLCWCGNSRSEGADEPFSVALLQSPFRLLLLRFMSFSSVASILLLILATPRNWQLRYLGSECFWHFGLFGKQRETVDNEWPLDVQSQPKLDSVPDFVLFPSVVLCGAWLWASFGTYHAHDLRSPSK